MNVETRHLDRPCANPSCGGYNYYEDETGFYVCADCNTISEIRCGDELDYYFPIRKTEVFRPRLWAYCRHSGSSAISVLLSPAFETIYFWPGLERCFGEVARVLKKGGSFMIVNESDGTDKTSKKFESIIDGMCCYTPAEITAALKAAGFTSVKSDHHPSKPWITVIAKK